jgi:hypothetical protein
MDVFQTVNLFMKLHLSPFLTWKNLVGVRSISVGSGPFEFQVLLKWLENNVFGNANRVVWLHLSPRLNRKKFRKTLPMSALNVQKFPWDLRWNIIGQTIVGLNIIHRMSQSGRKKEMEYSILWLVHLCSFITESTLVVIVFEMSDTKMRFWFPANSRFLWKLST